MARLREEFGEGSRECGQEVEEFNGEWRCWAEDEIEWEEGEVTWDLEMISFHLHFIHSFEGVFRYFFLLVCSSFLLFFLSFYIRLFLLRDLGNLALNGMVGGVE